MALAQCPVCDGMVEECGECHCCANETVEDALSDILDICTGWSRRMSGAERLKLIAGIARKALIEADVAIKELVGDHVPTEDQP
jgi:hypothetical protein